MAKRLHTRLSAGAALVTGLGMMGIATAVPAQAATTMQFSCTTPIGDQVFDVMLDTDAPESVAPGEELSITPSGTVTLNPNTSNAMAGALGWEYVSGEIPGVVATISDGTQSAEISTDLSIPKTHIFDGDNGGWTQDDTPDLPIQGTTETATVTQIGEYTVSAPTTFEATFSGYDAEGAPTGDPITSTCTYVEGSGSQVIDTVVVTDEPVVEEPTDPPAEEEPTEPPAEEEPTEPPATEEPVTEEPVTEEPTEPAPTTPQVPAVVQTDGLTPAMTSQEDHSAALALGGLFLAGAGAGTVLVMRRRAQQH